MEILILCIVYMSMAAGVYIGFAGKAAAGAYRCLIVLIPVLVTYYSRKHIRSYPLFICINIVFVFIAAALSKIGCRIRRLCVCGCSDSCTFHKT